MEFSDVDSSTEMDFDLSAEMDASNIDPLAEMEAHQIFREVYREFYEWEQADAQASIDRLVCQNPDDSFPDRGKCILGGMDACLLEDEDCIIVDIKNEIKPHPPYTSCAPVSRNVLLPDNADLGLGIGVLSHVPFADHPAFDQEQFLRDCIALNPDLTYGWQTDFMDPDVEIIRIEVVKRLYKARLPLDALGHLLGNVGHDTGLLWSIHQRDRPNILDWFSEAEVETLDRLKNEVPRYKTESVFDAMNICEPAYCSICERAACGTHRPEKNANIRFPVLLEKTAKLSAEELYDSDVAPCGKDCFKHVDMARYEDESKVKSDIDRNQFIEGVLKIDPDILPCDLSFTSKLSCKQIFIYRARFLRQAEDRRDADRRSSGPSRLADAVQGPAIRAEQSFSSPAYPCVHDGPCDGTAIGCQCFLSLRQCLRSCNCAPTCHLRRKGCSCYKDGGCNVLNKCPCALVKQECDPELCRKCGARNQIARRKVDPDAPTAGHNRVCNNVDVQRATLNDDLIAIQESQFGNGAFSTSDLRTASYLGEYHGQIKWSHAPGTTMDNSLTRYTTRNYAFNLNDEVVIDADSVGNVTRYLNHKQELTKGNKHGHEYANCVADIVYANDEQHIVLRTVPAIDADKELTLCYGEGYWTQSKSKGSKAAET